MVNGLSYIAVLAGLFLMRVRPNERVAPHTAILQNLKDGFVYAFGFMPIRSLLLLLALVSLTGASYSQLLPMFAQEILHGGPRTQGYWFPRRDWARWRAPLSRHAPKRAWARLGDCVGSGRFWLRPDRPGPLIPAPANDLVTVDVHENLTFHRGGQRKLDIDVDVSLILFRQEAGGKMLSEPASEDGEEEEPEADRRFPTTPARVRRRSWKS